MVDIYLKSHGIKAKWLSQQLGIEETRFCHFRRGRENLTDEKYFMLENYLQTHN